MRSRTRCDNVGSRGAAAAHDALGHRELSRSLEASAVEQGLAYIADPPPYEYNYLVSWLGMNARMPELSFLVRSIERRAAAGNRQGMHVVRSAQSELLRKIEAAPNLETLVVARASAAHLRAGDIAAARDELSFAQMLAETAASADGPDVDRDRLLAVTEAALVLAEGDAERAVALLAPVVQAAEKHGAPVSPSIRTAFGLALEATGDLDAAQRELDAAVGAFEGAREGIAIADRGAFFRRDERAAYHGLVRLWARRAAASGEGGDFFEALRASERIRARQLGERLLQRGFDLGAVDDLAALAAGLAESEAWLDYVVTESGTVLLALTRDGHLASLLTPNAKDLGERIDRLRERTVGARRGGGDATLRRDIESLSRDLFGPAASLLENKTRWVVLPDGPLSSLPLDLLLAPGRGPLIEGIEVTVAPSIALLHAKPAGAVASGGFFAVGDPLFAEESPLSATERGASTMRIAPLPETRSEVARIAALFASEEVTTLFADRATESTVRKSDLRRYRILHFATHGVLGGQLPQLNEPALVMAREPGEDGFLTASEVERLDLSAEVAVLSACDTGRGEYVAGEGVLGLGRAFMVAGARSVVISLWPVDSLATEELMVAFYRHLQKIGRVAEALRLAKLEMRAGELSGSGGRRSLTLNPGTDAQPVDRSAPYYWAGFAVMSR